MRGQEESLFWVYVGSLSRTCNGLLRGAQLSPADLIVTLGVEAGAPGARPFLPTQLPQDCFMMSLTDRVKDPGVP